MTLRLESLRAGMRGEIDPAAITTELDAALEELRETKELIDEQAIEYEELMDTERRRYKDLFELAPDAYLVTDGLGVIREANSAAAQLFRRHVHHLIGKPLQVFALGEDRRRIRVVLLQLARRASVGEFEVSLITPDGARSVEVRVASEERADGAVLVQWLLRDITARKQAEAEIRALNADLELRIDERTRELREFYARLETVLQRLPEGVLIIDASGELELANRRAEELLAASFDEIAASLRERTWTLGTMAPGPEEPVRDLLERVAVGERELNGRFRYRRKTEELVLEARTAPVLTEAGVSSVVMTFQDVTARELRERAERDFVTNAAHELQTPIAAIASAVDVLQAGAKRRAADRDHFLSHVEAACLRLQRLTRALLVLARAQTRAEAPRRELIAVGPLLDAIAAGLSSDSAVDVQCEDDLAVIANRPLLEQALENLGQNALKHASGPVLLAGGRENGAVVIRVRDRGDGIPVGERERIFERFYRATKTPAEGFGLGLAIVSEAVAALDGELELDTSPDGTAISIKLPAATLIQS